MNLLDDIEKVVDDFCLSEEEIENVTLKDFEQEMLNHRLQEVDRQHRERLEREYYNGFHREDQYERMCYTDKCIRCGRTMEVKYKRAYDMPSLNFNDYNKYSEVSIRTPKYSTFSCSFCGERYNIIGKIISIKIY